jgi:hypothetical membrane protein
MPDLPHKRVFDGGLQIGLLCLAALAVLFLGQLVAQMGTTAPYSASHQAISELGITRCGTFQQPQTGDRVFVCSPLHLVMNGTFVLYGALIMLAAMLAIRPQWPGRRMRLVGLGLIFFGGIEAIVSGFSPLDVAPFLHTLSGGLAIGALDLGLVLLGFAAVRTRKVMGGFALLCGMAGLLGMVLSSTAPYPGLGYGGWERVAGFAFAVWGIAMGAYWLSHPATTEAASAVRSTRPAG